MTGRGRRGAEAGFTLIELLVVVAILPLVIGAAAMAIITTEENAPVVQSRISNSINAQLASAYWSRDVRGASLITTDAAIAAPFTVSNPQPCGSGATLLLSSLRITGSAANSVSYWVANTSPAQIVRFYCTVTITTYPGVTTSAPSSTVVISDDVPPSQPPATIVPTYFGHAAAAGWAPTSTTATAFNNTTLTLPLSAATIALDAPPAGFVVNSVGAPVVLATSTGPQAVTCTGISGSSFTGCSGGTAATVQPGAQISQQGNVSGVAMTSAQAGSGYYINLLADPRTGAGAAGGGGGGSGRGPSLLTTGGGTTLDVKGTTTVNVDGSVALDKGSLTCKGTDSFAASGSIGGTGASTISGGCTVDPQPTAGVYAPDPFGPYVPPNPGANTAFPEPPAADRYNNPAKYNSPVTLSPGEYKNAVALVAGAAVTLTPGVYVLDQGISVTGGASLQVASDFAADGVLLYVPCNRTDTWAPSCAGSVALNAGTIGLMPLNDAQSYAYFGPAGGNLPYPYAESGLWMWQNVGSASGASFGGNGSAITVTGTAYLPGAAVTLDGTGALTVGRVIAQTLTFTGTNTTTVTGQ